MFINSIIYFFITAGSLQASHRVALTDELMLVF